MLSRLGKTLHENKANPRKRQAKSHHFSNDNSGPTDFGSCCIFQNCRNENGKLWTLLETTDKPDEFRWVISDIKHLLSKSKADSKTFTAAGEEWKLSAEFYESQIRSKKRYEPHLGLYIRWIPFPFAGPEDYQVTADCLIKMHGMKKRLKNTFYEGRGELLFMDLISLSKLEECINNPNSKDQMFVVTIQIKVDSRREKYEFNDKDTINDCEIGANNNLDRNIHPPVGILCHNFSTVSVLSNILQYLYHIKKLRKSIYKIPVSRSSAFNVTLSIQAIFYYMQYNEGLAVDPMVLMKVCGFRYRDLHAFHEFWDFLTFFTQKIVNNLDMNHHQNIFKSLFVGQCQSTIKGLDDNTDVHLTNIQDFELLQLEVVGVTGLIDSINKSCERDRKLHSIQIRGNLVPARQYIEFTNFPPILQILLKRIKYDSFQDKNIKLLDKFEFPIILDLEDPSFLYGPKQQATSTHQNSKHIYKLFAIIIHEGNISKHGHYVTFINSSKHNYPEKWHKFNDEKVSMVDTETVLEDGYRGAYFLSYIRMDQWEEILCPEAEVGRGDFSTMSEKLFKQIMSMSHQRHNQTRQSYLSQTILTSSFNDTTNNTFYMS